MVLPSGVAAANALKPIVPEAPSRLFTTTCWPDWSANALATARPITSTPLPAGNGMIISIGRAGHFCALASNAIGASAIAATKAPFHLMTFSSALTLRVDPSDGLFGGVCASRRVRSRT
jgi:hypothetical protein